jgi:hypothetical protein
MCRESLNSSDRSAQAKIATANIQKQPKKFGCRSVADGQYRQPFCCDKTPILDQKNKFLISAIWSKSVSQSRLLCAQAYEVQEASFISSIRRTGDCAFFSDAMAPPNETKELSNGY